jgi:hypothetical protein
MKKLDHMLSWADLRGMRLDGMVLASKEALSIIASRAPNERAEWLRYDIPHSSGTKHAELLATMLQAYPHIRRLEPISCMYESWVPIVSAHCPLLQHLELSSFGTSISDADFLALCTGCPQIEYLNLGYYIGLSDEGLLAGLAILPKLHQLIYFPGVPMDNSVFSAIGRLCPRLSTFNTFSSRPHSEAEVLHYAACFPLLTSIGAKARTAVQTCLSCSGYRELFRLCPRVHAFSVPMEMAMEDAECVLLEHTHLTSLSVGISESCAILHVVARTCAHLLHLSVAQSKHARLASSQQRALDDALLAVAAACPKLQTLEFTSFGTLTVDSAIAFTQSCPSLRQLRLQFHNDALTVPQLQRLAQAVPRLFIKAPDFAVPKYDVLC